MRRRFAWSLAVLTSCTAPDPDPPSEVVPEPAATPTSPEPRGPTRDLGPLVGGVRELETPTPGRYATRISARQHRFITMEMTVEDSLDGGAVLELHADGRATACFWAQSGDAGSISEYASPDHEPHHHSSSREFRLAASGSWTAEPDARRAKVELRTVDYGTCELGAKAYDPPDPLELSCHSITAAGKLVVDAIICRVPADKPDLASVAMALEPNPRSGPWAIREDSSGRYPRAFGEEVSPWLLLGNPGLSVGAWDLHERDPMLVLLAADDVVVPLGELEWRRR